MNRLFVFCILCACFALVLSIDSSESSEENETGHSKCAGMEEVDLSEFNLHIEDLRQLELKRAQEPDSSDILEDELYNDLKVSVIQYALGSERKLIITPNRTKIYTKTFKASDTRANLSTTITGSLNTTVTASTTGTENFNIDVTSYGKGQLPSTLVTGDSEIQSNSSSKWVKKYRVNVLETETKSSSDSRIKMAIQQSDQADDDVEVELNVSSSVSSVARTLFVSKNCFGTKASSTFNTSIDGTGWSVNITGSGNAGVYSHVLFSNKNGSSATWTFAKVTIKAESQVKAKDVSEYIVIKSFTETLTRPVPSDADGITIEVTAVTKIRVEVKSKVSGGYKVYASGGEVVQRKSKVVIPESMMVGEADQKEGEHVLLSEDLVSANLVRSQIQAEEMISNPIFTAFMSLEG